MYISTVKVLNFRNYESLVYKPQQGLNLILGDNGQGKTNLLEAIYLCCIGKSHRAKKDDEMIRWGEEKSAYCGVTVERRDGHRTVEVMLSKEIRKRVKVLGSSISRMSELMGHINCVFFSPEDLLLIKGGPSSRRKFLDVTLCQMRPAYYTALVQYNYALAQRNALLKRYNDQRKNELDAYDAALSVQGGKIIAQRNEFCKALRPVSMAIHKGIAKNERLEIEYISRVHETDANEAAERLYEQLQLRREDDIRRVMTTAGPHRDDLATYIDGKDCRAFGSQGQQRTAVLSLKLSAMELMREETGEMPVLMLDDVLSELDEYRRDALLAGISGQAFITAAFIDEATMKNASVIRIKSGCIQGE